MYSLAHTFTAIASSKRNNGDTCVSSASLLLGCILSKIEVMLYEVVKVLFVCALHAVISRRLHTIAYFLRCVNTFFREFWKNWEN